MPIRGMRPAGVALLIGLSSFATRTNADQCNHVTIERVLDKLNAAAGAIAHDGDVTPEQKVFAVDAIQAAVSMLDEIPLESR